MENKNIYGIFSGEYSDWSVHGYFNDEEEAMKYCALKNKNRGDYDKYYHISLNQINADVKNVKLNYYHEVVFDFKTGMRKEPDRYEYYIGEDRPSKSKYNTFIGGNNWISFSFNCDTREKAEKIAQDKYAEFLAYYSENNDYDISAKLIGSEKL